MAASAGATRVVTDAGWMSYDRQIGTTGVAVSPELYVAFGISGAAQHVGGLGAPEHVVSVNTDPSCPMTLMADLGIVADAPAVLAELAERLGVTAAHSARAAHAGLPSCRRGRAMPDDVMTVDAVVVGAGPAGAAAALSWPGPAGTWCWWSAGSSPARRTSMAAWCTGGSWTRSCRGGGRRCRYSAG